MRGIRCGGTEGWGAAYLRLGASGGKLSPGALGAKASNIFGQVDGGTLGGEERRRKGGRASHVEAADLAAADNLTAMGGQEFEGTHGRSSAGRHFDR